MRNPPLAAETAPQTTIHSQIRPLPNFIGGRWVPSESRENVDVHNPALGTLIARTPLSTRFEVDAAVAAAAAGEEFADAVVKAERFEQFDLAVTRP